MRKGTMEQASPMTILVVAVAFTTGLLAGCSSMTTSPLQDASSRAEIAGTAGVQGTSTATLPDDAPPSGGASGSPGGTAPPTTPPPSNDVTSVLAPFSPGGVPVTSLTTYSTTLQSGKKGSLTLGRWRVDVPADALAGDATITLGIPSWKSTGCQVLISPAELSPFAAPLTLTADCRGVAPHRLAGYVMLQFNPTTLAWETVPGSSVDTKHKLVTAPIARSGIFAAGSATIR